MNKSNFFKTFCKTACKSQPDRVIAAACSARAKRSTRVMFLRKGYSRLPCSVSYFLSDGFVINIHPQFNIDNPAFVSKESHQKK